MEKTDYQSLFPHYVLKSTHLAVLREYERICGFEITGGDQVKNITDFRECISSNLRWLENLHTDTYKAVNRVAFEKIGGL